MRNVKIRDDVGFFGKRKGAHKVDYYLVDKGEVIYAFTTDYTNGSYNLYKSVVPVNRARCVKTHDPGIMRVTNKLNRMLPYLAEEYGLCK